MPDEELPEATRWLVRDLVDFDVDQAQIAVLKLPESDRRQHSARLFVIAAREGSLVETAQAITDAGLTLSGIEILETAMIALAGHMPETVAGHGVLWLDEKSSALTISREEHLILARGLSVEAHALDEAAQLAVDLDADPEAATRAQDLLGPLLLEVQRSFDYYESEHRTAPVSQLTLLPCEADAALLARAMTEPLRPLRIEAFELERYFEVDEMPAARAQANIALAAGTATARADLLGDALVPGTFQEGRGGFGLDTLLRVAVLVSFLMLGVYAWSYSQLNGERQRLGELEAEHAALQAAIEARVEEQKARSTRADPAVQIEALTRLRDAGLATLRDLDRGNTDSIVPFSNIMEALARQNLENVWIERIELTDGGAEIALEGRALDAADLPTFLRGLGTEPSFASREFGTLDFVRPNDTSRGLRFRIDSRVLEGEEERLR